MVDDPSILQRMRLSGTVTEIWRIKDSRVTTLTLSLIHI